MRCYWEIEKGKVNANFVMHIVCTHHLRGPLARTLQLRATFFDAFSDVGSERAKAFLVAKLQRAAADPAADALRAGIGPSPSSSLDQIVDALEGRIVHMLEGRMQLCIRRELAAALPPALRLMQLAPEAVQVNLNSSRRSNPDLRGINVPPPLDRDAETALIQDTLLVTTFLTQKFAASDLHAEVKKRAVQGFKSCFSCHLKVRKQTSMAGAQLPMAGQIGRAQVQYRQSDRPLMEQIWGELREHREQLVERIVSRIAAAAAAAPRGPLGERERSRSPVGRSNDDHSACARQDELGRFDGFHRLAMPRYA